MTMRVLRFLSLEGPDLPRLLAEVAKRYEELVKLDVGAVPLGGLSVAPRGDAGTFTATMTLHVDNDAWQRASLPTIINAPVRPRTTGDWRPVAFAPVPLRLWANPHANPPSPPPPE